MVNGQVQYKTCQNKNKCFYFIVLKSYVLCAFPHREGGFLERVEEPHAAFTTTSITYADDETDSDRLAMFETPMYSEQLAQGQVKITHKHSPTMF